VTTSALGKDGGPSDEIAPEEFRILEMGLRPNRDAITRVIEADEAQGKYEDHIAALRQMKKDGMLGNLTEDEIKRVYDEACQKVAKEKVFSSSSTDPTSYQYSSCSACAVEW